MREERRELAACDFSDHGTGNAACRLCERGYPRPCDCGGPVHAEMVKVEGNGSCRGADLLLQVMAAVLNCEFDALVRPGSVSHAANEDQHDLRSLAA